MEAAKIDKGSVFRKIDRWGNVSARALEPSAINGIVKQHAQMAGLDASEFSAHGLRSGYLTEAANRWHTAARSDGTIASSLRPAGF
ncbi:putative site-specific integrase [Ochrobactrum quorumnocens]|uniref:Putative site-specific integrase n=1 Tax=Ochrobactrum quorumnocens TaxID=271865 RepID=A0A248UC79_9HYPH|nr:putative site-specific integrase [[Ochrobactrum] quorumnocens]